MSSNPSVSPGFSPKFLGHPRGASQTDDSEPDIEVTPARRPAYPTAAFTGLGGEFVRLVAPHTEASPVALLVQFHAALGNVVGRQPYYMVDGTRHYPNLFVALVGATAVGRKGTSWRHVFNLFEMVAPEWARQRVASGLSSGEGVIWHVRDQVTKRKAKKNDPGQFEEVTEDEGISDKRLLVQESELSSALKMFGRDGNILSPILRDAWDTGRLGTLTKNNPTRATGAHISVVGHITKDELLRCLDRTEVANGLANRFMWFSVRRSKSLPDGGCLREEDLRPLVERLKVVVAQARARGEMTRTAEARAEWHAVYDRLSAERPGLLGAILGRAAPQVVRLSLLYALADGSPVIELAHLRAALSLWQYAEDSVRLIFGDALGDPAADKILDALRDVPWGLTRSEMRDGLFKRHNSHEMDRALKALLELDLVRFELDATAGRPAQRFFATGEDAR